LKCTAEDKQWGERRERWEKTVTGQKKTIKKVRHEESRIIPYRLWANDFTYPSLQEAVSVEGSRAAEVFYVLKALVEILRKKRFHYVSPLPQEVWHRLGSSALCVHQGTFTASTFLLEGGSIVSMKTRTVSKSCLEGRIKIALALLRTVGQAGTDGACSRIEEI
jgi:hypothetical protein